MRFRILPPSQCDGRRWRRHWWVDVGVRYIRCSRDAPNSSQLDRWKIQLRTLDDGEPHPSARTAVLSFAFELHPSRRRTGTGNLSITSSRLAFFCSHSGPTKTKVIVWDWTTGEILLVRSHHFISLSTDSDYLSRTSRTRPTGLRRLLMISGSQSSSRSNLSLKPPRGSCSWIQNRRQRVIRSLHKLRSIFTLLGANL